jgi:hypothetical protein
MKSFNFIHFLLFILLFIAYQCANAQDFVLTQKGDTVYGEVKPLTYGPDPRVNVIGEGKKKVSYTILQVKSYQFKGDTYEPVRNDKGYTFMKVIRPGYLTLYGFQGDNQVGFDQLFLQKRDGTFLEVPNLSFKKLLKKYLEECTVVASKVESGELSKKDIVAIVDEYNACIDRRSSVTFQSPVKSEKPLAQTSAWNTLEEKVNAQVEFEGKSDALEMINEIKIKIQRGEKVPKFMTEGLKNSLSKTDLTTDLDQALKELPQ